MYSSFYSMYSSFYSINNITCYQILDNKTKKLTLNNKNVIKYTLILILVFNYPLCFVHWYAALIVI
jgi:hypothetical protein